MAPSRNDTRRNHAVYDRRSRPREPGAPAPAGDDHVRRWTWKRTALLVVVAAVVVGLIFAARSLAHWPDAFF